ncbi:hypothetical protein A2U01_0038376, partial [Trifolium medium]|nr:hypothetical protein [Trifolium medium]
MIGAGLGWKDHGSIPATAIGRGLEPLDAITDPRTRLGSPVGRILVVKMSLIFSFSILQSKKGGLAAWEPVGAPE